jgi:hypothetical protein
MGGGELLPRQFEADRAPLAGALRRPRESQSAWPSLLT